MQNPSFEFNASSIKRFGQWHLYHYVRPSFLFGNRGAQLLKRRQHQFYNLFSHFSIKAPQQFWGSFGFIMFSQTGERSVYHLNHVKFDIS